MNINHKLLYTASLFSLIMMGCTSRDKSSDEEQKEPTKTVRVTVTQAEEKEYTPSLHLSGTVEANREANLGSSLPGRIEKINYPIGSYVPEGATIVELSDEMLVQAEIELAAIRKDFERISRLKEKNSISLMDYDHIKAKYEATQAKVDMVKKNTSIRAPFSGVLVDIMVEEGENYSFIPSVSQDLKVKSGIVTIMQLNPLKVKVDVNEKELSMIKKGQDVDLSFDSYPDEMVTGKVTYISPILSASTRSSIVEITIPNGEQRLKPGMFCRASIQLQQTKGVFVPINAIYRTQGTGDDYVFVLQDNGTVKRTKVTRGESIDDQVCLPELRPHTTVIIDGKNKLDDGAEVTVIEA